MVSDPHRALNDEQKGVVRCWHSLRNTRMRRQRDIEINRLGRAVRHGPRFVGNRPNIDVAVTLFRRYIGCRKLLVRRRRQFVAFRQVDPQLRAPHQAILLLRHFRVNDAATGRHPLHAARPNNALVAGVVAVTHLPGKHISHGLETAVRVRRKTSDVIVGIVAFEHIE